MIPSHATTARIVPIRDHLWSYVLVHDRRRAAVVIFDDLIPIGLLRWLALVSLVRDVDAGMIGMVYVDPDHRPHGVA